MIARNAKKEDIIKYIKENMGLVPPEDATVAQLFEFIEANGGQVGGTKGGENTSDDGIDKGSGIDMKDRVNIIIPKSDDERGSEDVFVGCNGAGFLIKRGVRAEVPRAVLGVLKDAVTKKMVEVANDKGESTGAYEYQDVPSYPYQIVD